LEGWELSVGDLCLFTGDEKFSSLKSRLVYQVVSKEDATMVSGYPQHRYRYRVAFDLENPSGTSTDTSITFSSTRGMKKITLLDLGTLRLHLDEFVRWYARYKGMEADATRSDTGSDGAAGPASRRDPDQGQACP
jgi:hypothetical protein